VLKLLPEISSQGHDTSPLIVFQKFNHYKSDQGETTESVKKFDPLCANEKWHVHQIWVEDITAETMEPKDKFGWIEALIDEKKGKQTQVRAEPKQDLETKG